MPVGSTLLSVLVSHAFLWSLLMASHCLHPSFPPLHCGAAVGSGRRQLHGEGKVPTARQAAVDCGQVTLVTERFHWLAVKEHLVFLSGKTKSLTAANVFVCHSDKRLSADFTERGLPVPVAV